MIVARDRGTDWPIADRRVPSNDPRNNCWTHFDSSSLLLTKVANRPFPSSPGPLYQNEVKCSAFNIEMIFYLHANETHFPRKVFAPGLIFESEGCWNSEVA